MHKRLKIPEMNWADCDDDEHAAFEKSSRQCGQLSENANAKFQSSLTEILNEFLTRENATT